MTNTVSNPLTHEGRKHLCFEPQGSIEPFNSKGNQVKGPSICKRI